MMTAAKYLLTLAMGVLCLSASAGEAIVAVASNFTAPMKAITAEFESETGHRIELAFGSSGKFHAQIRNGAPFQAFFSADQAKPEALEMANLTVPGSRFTYALGKLALWSTEKTTAEQGLRALTEGHFDRLAIANPKLAPYGAAALEVLQHLEIMGAVEDKIVVGENIAQAYQFVSTGNVDLGFIALAQTKEPGRATAGAVWPVPGKMHSPIRQDAVLLLPGAQNEAARELLQFVKSDKGRAIIEAYGYQSEAVD